MRDLPALINRYLNRATQYAIQITGPWGSGKTFYYENTLLPTIVNRETYFDAKSKYVPIYVSLFGLKTVEEIQVKILLEIINYQTAGKLKINPKNIRITANLFKLLLQGFMSLSRLGQLKEYGSIVQDVGKSVLESRQLVICFDDIERKSAELNIDNFIGYVNNIIDAGTKVLLICNEDKIDDKHYQAYKEKIIGTTVIYQPEIGLVLNQIVKSRYNNPFREFLLSELVFIEKALQINQSNYRHLIYAFDNFQDVFAQIHLSIIDTRLSLAKMCKEHLPDIFRFALGTAMDFKQDLIANSDFKYFRDVNQGIRGIDQNAAKFYEREESLLVKKRESIKSFIEKYFSNQEHYKFYGSIFSFISGGQEFDVKQFENEFVYNYHLLNGDVLPQYQILEDLANDKCLLLSDAEYQQKTEAMLGFAEKGEYFLNEYEGIYEYALRFNNVLGLNEKKVVEQLKAGMSAYMSAQADAKNAEDNLMSFAVYTEIGKELKNFGFQLVDKFTLAQDEQKMHDLMYRFSENITTFQEQYDENKEFMSLVNRIPFLHLANPAKVEATILAANAHEILFLRRFFRRRYTETKNIELEFDNLKVICRGIAKSISDNSSGLKGYQINSMLRELKGYNSDLLADQIGSSDSLQK